jgi:sugar/nucleoside kinase (ribokinase family)
MITLSNPCTIGDLEMTCYQVNVVISRGCSGEVLMNTAVVAGHVCVDLVPSLSVIPPMTPGVLAEVGRLGVSAGGCVGGTGRALAELGTPTRLAAVVGDDKLGEILLSQLNQFAPDTSGVVRHGGRSTSYSIVLEPDGQDRAFWHHSGANHLFDGTALDLTGASLLHLGYPSLLPALYGADGEPWIVLLRRARRDGVITSLDLATVDPRSPAADVNWRRLLSRVLPLTDLISPSVEDLTSALGRSAPRSLEEVAAMAGELLALGAAVVLLTAGRSGMLLATGSRSRLEAAGAGLAEQAGAWADRRLWVPSVAVKVRTTTGAGDAATAGLVHAVLQGLDPEAAAQSAARSAARRIGGPDLAETNVKEMTR